MPRPGRSTIGGMSCVCVAHTGARSLDVAASHRHVVARGTWHDRVEGCRAATETRTSRFLFPLAAADEDIVAVAIEIVPVFARLVFGGERTRITVAWGIVGKTH